MLKRKLGIGHELTETMGAHKHTVAVIKYHGITDRVLEMLENFQISHSKKSSVMLSTSVLFDGALRASIDL